MAFNDVTEVYGLGIKQSSLNTSKRYNPYKWGCYKKGCVYMYELDGILYAGSNSPMIKVVDVKPLPDYKLVLSFSNGASKIYDVTPLLELPAFQVLKDVNVFNKVYIDFDTVTWCNEGIDIAPETLFIDGTDYEQSIVS